MHKAKILGKTYFISGGQYHDENMEPCEAPDYRKMFDDDGIRIPGNEPTIITFNGSKGYLDSFMSDIDEHNKAQAKKNGEEAKAKGRQAAFDMLDQMQAAE